jgi:uncharacterized glyoxalase superfamily protein PhnB
MATSRVNDATVDETVVASFCSTTRHPNISGGGDTQSLYVVVTDADAVYAKAKAAGAKIAMEIRNEDYGGRDFSCYDPEGHLWSFGTYNP